MGKTSFIGIDIGYDYLKLALVNRNVLKKAALIPMEDNMIKDGKIVSVDALGDFIRTAMKQNGFHSSDAAVVLLEENSFVRTVSVPQMTEEQLMYNLPFEFRDYISGELKDYIFDYAMISNGDDNISEDGFDDAIFEEDNDEKKMEVLAAAASVDYISELKLTMRKAGMKLIKAAPPVCTYRNLILEYIRKNGGSDEEYCMIDIGYTGVRMHIFKGERYIVSRTIEIGMNALDAAVADLYNVDIHLAHTYFTSNYDNCQEKPECLDVFNNIAVEVQRAVNFYRFSNPDSMLRSMWLCGGGVTSRALVNALRSIDLEMHLGDELLNADHSVENLSVMLQACGIAYMD